MKLSKIFNSIIVILKSNRSMLSFFKKGSSIASTQVLHCVKLYVDELQTIFDVGANQGQFAMTAAYYFPHAKIYSFEPVQGSYDKLKLNTSKFKNITSYNFALGNEQGNINFFSNAYSHASSALPVSDLQKVILPQTSEETVIKARIKKLDDISSDYIFAPPVLLKLDVQGFEKEVLKGAVESLKEIDFLLVESSFVPMYQGEPLFDEMHSYVKDQGFELIGPVGILQSDNLQILQMDMLYKRKNK